MGHESDEKTKDISTVIILSPADVEYTVGFSRLNFPDLFFTMEIITRFAWEQNWQKSW